MYSRPCPKCSIEIIYKTVNGLKAAERNKTICMECKNGKHILFRNCPKCNVKMGYASEKYYLEGVKKNLCCRSCKNPTILYNCKGCNKSLKTSTVKSEFCLECKEQNSVCYKDCFECGFPISYTNKYDREIGIQNNTVCITCVKKKQSIVRKGKTNYDLWIAKGISIDIATLKWQASENKRLESRDGYKHSPETVAKILNHANCKRFIVKGLSCQGNWEKIYIENCDDSNLPTNPKYVKTPIGLYIPDFEYEDRFVEIKSTFTYAFFMKTKVNFRNPSTTNQRDKIIWTGSNIKPVQLLILDSKGEILKEEWYTKEGIKVKKDLTNIVNPITT